MAAYYTTRMTDRNGNYANISYTQGGSPEIQNVVTSDGRRIDFSYLSLAGTDLTRRINTITAQDDTGNRVYQYGYQPVANGYGGYQLTSVTRPGGSQWQYSYFGNFNGSRPGSFLLSGVTYPESGAISYSYGSGTNDYVYFDLVHSEARTTVVKSKTTSDGGYWGFNYSPGAPGRDDTTTVSTPGGQITYTHVSPNSAGAGSLWTVGLLKSKQVGASQTETYTWVPQVISNQRFNRPGAWQTTQFDDNTAAPLLSRKVIIRDGASFSNEYGAFDLYGNPGVVFEAGPNGGSRTTNISYFQNSTLWILNEPMNESVSGGVQIARTFDGVGNMRTLSRDGVTTSYDYFSDGGVSRATYPRGLNHYYWNYKRGIPQNESQPESVNLSRSVSDSGNVLTEVNGRSNATAYNYDGLNRLTAIYPPRGNPTFISYGYASKSATRGGLNETTVYDGFRRPQSITLGGVARQYAHDALGRTTFVSDPASSSGTSYQYDILGRVSYVTNADGTNRAISFPAGAKQVRDERGYSTTYSFRSYGDPGEQFLIAVAAPDPSTSVNLQRNPQNRVTQVSQGGFTRQYGYDGRGFLTSVINPETGSTIYGRDDANNMVSKSVGNSGTTTYTYDGQNRLAGVSYPGGTPGVTKTYTQTNKLESVSSVVATRNYNYDANENLAGEYLNHDGFAFQLTYGYNGNDQLSSLTYPRSARVVNYGPDSLGRPTQASGFVNGVSYWPSGQIYEIVYANGTYSRYGQNNRLWPSYFLTANSSTSWVNSSYGYDGLGNLNSISDSADTSYNRTLGYDPVNRLTSASGPWGSGAISYDGAGNIRSQSFGGGSLSYGYDSTNRLNSVSGVRNLTFAYDSYGDVIGDGTREFRYDGAPNMSCANCSDANSSVQYQYDGLNQRVSVLKAAVKTYEFYGLNGNLLAEFTPSLSNRLTEHVYLGRQRIASVGAAVATITLPAQSMTVVAGQTIALDATVGGGSSPTGTVTFSDGATSLGTFPVVGGHATLTTTLQSLGVHTIVASYSGDTGNFGSSTSVTVTVLSATTITGPAGGTGFTAIAGKPTTLAATINGNSPTGTVSFYDGSTLLGTATLMSGTASLTTTISTAGTHTITMVYSGDGNNAASTATATLFAALPIEQFVPILQLLLD